MKKILTTLLICVSGMAGAQYFQHKYSSATNSTTRLDDGFNVRVGAGHVLSGYTYNGAIVVQKTVIDGQIPALPGFFNKEYPLNIGGFVMVNSAKCVELPTGDIVVMGGFSGSNTGLYFMRVDVNGNVLFSKAYRGAGNNGYPDFTITKVIYSPITGFVYTCGYCDRGTVVMCVDNTGNLQWGKIYDINSMLGGQSRPYGIAESFVANINSGVTELVLAGRFFGGAGITDKGFIFRVDKANGNAISPVSLYGDNTNPQYFTGIKLSNNPGISLAANRYVLSGNYNNSGGATPYYWFLGVDQIFTTPAWSNLFAMDHYSNTCDVIERFNRSNNYEYYIAGNSDSNPLNFDEEMIVIKADNLGNGVTNGKFIYLDAALYNDAAAIDMYNTGSDPQDGISIFGTANTAGAEHNLVKAYFNGVTACNYRLEDPVQVSGPGYYADIYPVLFDNMDQYPLDIFSPQDGYDRQICSSFVVDDGCNSMKAPAKGLPDKINDELSVLRPNPALPGSSNLVIALEGGSEPVTSVTVTIIDILGRNCYNGKVEANENGEFTIPARDLKTGTYTVRIQSINGVHTKILLVN